MARPSKERSRALVKASVGSARKRIWEGGKWGLGGWRVGKGEVERGGGDLTG